MKKKSKKAVEKPVKKAKRSLKKPAKKAAKPKALKQNKKGHTDYLLLPLVFNIKPRKKKK
ncbi:MAG: hypothetical protein KJ955_02720 [Nanoarchaeota archaeon]|nr:hypothetical protein [Nanoarchaeota archaeon]